jgi:hypothetical protein
MTATRADQKQGASPPPAPRGSTPTSPQPPRFRPSRAWIVFGLVLLAFNFYLGSRATQPPSRVRIPYSPFFLDQVRAGHVKEITSKGTAIQGTFTQKLTYAGSKPTTRFRTEIPAFADNDALTRLLEQKDVVVNAQPLDTGAPWWENLLLGFGPTILFIFLLFWLMRRAGNVQNVLGSFGRSRARRYQPSGDRVTFADVAGIDEAKAELTEVVDFLRHPDKYRKLGGRGRARRCSPARSRARRTCRSSRWPPRSSSRRSSASVPRASATCSSRRRSPRRRSCSSTSWTPSAAHARPASPASAAATTSASRR